MRDWIPGLQDHDLSRKQSLNQLSHPGARHSFYLRLKGTLTNQVTKSFIFTFPSLDLSAKPHPSLFSLGLTILHSFRCSKVSVE